MSVLPNCCLKQSVDSKCWSSACWSQSELLLRWFSLSSECLVPACPVGAGGPHLCPWGLVARLLSTHGDGWAFHTCWLPCHHLQQIRAKVLTSSLICLFVLPFAWSFVCLFLYSFTYNLLSSIRYCCLLYFTELTKQAAFDYYMK